MMANELENYSLNLADIIIQPDIEDARISDWHNREKYIEYGENIAKKAIPNIKRFFSNGKSLEGYSNH